MTLVAVAIVSLVLLLEAAVVLPSPWMLVLVGCVLWIALPGVVLARYSLGSTSSTAVAAWLVGPALGLAISVFGVFVWWALGIQGWTALLLGPTLTWTLALVMRTTGGVSLRLPSFDGRDAAIAALLVLMVPLITWAPYDHVREPVADGEAYRAYFTADFIWAMTVTSEVAKGEVPPANPFLRDQPLHYYWFAHFLSGAIYRNVSDAVAVEPVILINGLAFGAGFVLLAYFLARTVGAAPAFAAVVVAAGFCANSFEGADMIRAAATGHVQWSEIANTNIDAVTRWFYKGMAIDGLQRLLLYQPHHLTGYALALCALWLAALAEDVTAVGVALSAGTLLALGFLFSTFGAAIVSLAVGPVYVMRLWQQGALNKAWLCALLGGGVTVVGVMATVALGYTDNRYGSLLQVGVNPLALHAAWRIWILSFGPLLIGALATCVRPRWFIGQGLAPAALVTAATGFYFFTNVPDSGDVWVGWRAGHMLMLSFALMSGAVLTWLWQTPRWRLTVAIAAVILIALAVPTTAIDVYNAQDITNRTEGAGFPWTLVISPAEREALEWVRHSTPPNAVVQMEPDARGSAHWSYIGAFAGRRMMSGLPIAMTPITPYRRAVDDLKWGVFKTTQAADCHASARFMGIDYLFIGAPERRHYRPAVIAMLSDPRLFPVVFRNAEVTILQVAPIGQGAPAARLLAPNPR